MELWKIERARRADVDRAVADLAEHRRRKVGWFYENRADHDQEIVLLDKLDAARDAWNAAYDAADT